MAHPRRILPAQTYLITRRCCRREFRLRPSTETNEIFAYCLALAMEKTGVLLHAACVMSNHHHLVVSDPRGVLPVFLRELHRFIANAMNALQHQRDNLWAAQPTNVVRLVTDDDVDDKIAYVAANPVEAGLVEQPEAWPGFLAWGEKTFLVTRPKAYFRDTGRCPPTLLLVVEAPPRRNRDESAARGWIERVGRAIAEKVTLAHRAIHSAGLRFLGRESVLGASFVRRARSREVKQKFIPTFAARLKSVRDELRRIEQAFRAKYHAASELWRGGQRDVSFPYGTWWMRVFHVAATDPPLPA